MLQIALAGLVLNKVLTLKEAEKINNVLKNQPAPKTVKEIVEMIKKTKKEVKLNE